ncbi:MAG: Asp-tRNA(Asn)/Glu-tRNA(Gln) amidotransferase GatCAB subunit B, partial [Chloroflexi bacterium]|nr:Asp-tRNA(Asn)/Glu-tRNA(Gln) amidotransferase GatCAB subunit B [Chloroflexota bacterium]
IMGDLFRILNETGLSPANAPISAAQFAELLKLVAQGTINANTGSQVLKTMFQNGEDAAKIVAREGLAQVSDTDVLATAVKRVLASHPEEVMRYRAGKTQLLGWFVGQVMRETRGKANPGLVRQMLQEQLKT